MQVAGKLLIIAGLAAAAPAFGQGLAVPSVGPQSAAIEVIEHPRQYLAQAYPAVGLPLPGVADNRCFAGIRQGASNSRAVPGILCLDTILVSGVPRLDVSKFATCPTGVRPFIQSYRLTKEVPASKKCPLTYRARVFHQYGTGIRTWWALQFTPPGTVFTLEVTVRCTDPRRRKVTLHVDRWTWEVVATLDTLESAIHLMHTDALGTTEVPCIVDEGVYRALIDGVKTLRQARSQGRKAFEDSLFGMEGLIVAAAAFGDIAQVEEWFRAGPPGNRAIYGPAGLLGILETAENPCACKLMVDLEYIAQQEA